MASTQTTKVAPQSSDSHRQAFSRGTTYIRLLHCNDRAVFRRTQFLEPALARPRSLSTLAQVQQPKTTWCQFCAAKQNQKLPSETSGRDSASDPKLDLVKFSWRRSLGAFPCQATQLERRQVCPTFATAFFRCLSFDGVASRGSPSYVTVSP